VTPEGKETLEEMRVWALAAPTLRKLIAERKKYALDRLIADFRHHGVTSPAHTAVVAVLDELEQDINQKELSYNTLKERQK
jgi:hypothetical protein